MKFGVAVYDTHKGYVFIVNDVCHILFIPFELTLRKDDRCRRARCSIAGINGIWQNTVLVLADKATELTAIDTLHPFTIVTRSIM